MSRREGHAAPEAPRQARLFRNGRNQALRIPRDLEFPGDTVILHKEDDRLIVEPLRRKTYSGRDSPPASHRSLRSSRRSWIRRCSRRTSFSFVMAKLRYVLDTNIVSLVVREPEGTLERRLAAMARAEFGISVIAACELRYGVSRKGSARLATHWSRSWKVSTFSRWRKPADEHYGDIRAALERIGRPIGHNDLLIAAHARALGATLVTRNVDEFARVPNLEVESWPDQH